MSGTSALPTRFARCLFVTAILLASVHTAAAAIADTIERVKPSIVAIGSYQKTRTPAFSFKGTGFAVGDGTLVATNAHVVPQVLNAEARETLVVLSFGPGGKPVSREAKTVAYDRPHDLVLLRISGPALPALEIDDGESVREGQTFVFTGFPIGNALGFSAVTHRGMVSSITPVALPTPTARQLDEKVIRSLRTGPFQVFQLDATAYPGNSGSPLYDIESGRVVGIINMVFVKGTREAALTSPSGISFAIPAAFLKDLMAKTQ